jgi:hypothetical protein
MRDVSQISPPIRIVLAVAALFLVAWMTVLKPKSADVSAPTPTTTGNVATGKPAVSAPGKLAEKAKSAVESASAKHATTLEGETATPATGAATKSTTGGAAAAKPAPAAASGDLKGLPAAAVKAITQQKVMVVGFFTKQSADDRAVRKAMLKVDRWGGRVMVKAAPIGQIGAWGRVARGVDVQQSPTVVVVGRNLQATPLVGFVDKQTIDQVVVDSLRSSGGLFTNAYLRQVNHSCAAAASALFASPDARNIAQAPKLLTREAAILASFAGDLRSMKAPARYKAFKAATVKDVVAMRGAWTKLAKGVAAHPQRAAVVSSVVSFVKTTQPVGQRFDKRMRSNHVLSCVHG